MRFKSLFTAVFLAFAFLPAGLCADSTDSGVELSPAALQPSRSVSSELNDPYFWIGRAGAPDEAILSPEEIKELNRSFLLISGQMASIEELPGKITGDELLSQLLDGPIDELAQNPAYAKDGKRVRRKYIGKLRANMNIGSVKGSNRVRFGVITKRADIRALPTNKPIFARPGNNEFDILQYSGIYPGEKVALLHKSKDGKWGFFQTPFVRGWIELPKAGFGKRENVFREAYGLAVVTEKSARVYSDIEGKDLLDEMPMGSALKMEGAAAQGGLMKIKFPARTFTGKLVWRNAYVDGIAVNSGYLPYTKANVIRQAFKMLGNEYGWGGVKGRTDCSGFIKSVFASFGIDLPRNSRQQGAAGMLLANFEEEKNENIVSSALVAADPGITLVYMKGHIMLYLGELEGRPYVIHQFFGYEDPTGMNYIRKVAVTGLELGAGSKKGSLAQRVKSINGILMPSPFTEPPAGNPASDVF